MHVVVSNSSMIGTHWHQQTNNSALYRARQLGICLHHLTIVLTAPIPCIPGPSHSLRCAPESPKPCVTRPLIFAFFTPLRPSAAALAVTTSSLFPVCHFPLRVMREALPSTPFPDAPIYSLCLINPLTSAHWSSAQLSAGATLRREEKSNDQPPPLPGTPPGFPRS